MRAEAFGVVTMDDVKVYKTVCMLCFQVCGINAYVKDGALLKVEGMKEHPFSRGVICPRGQRLASVVYSQDRLRYPMEKRDGHWGRISWDQALDRIATHLEKIKRNFGARAVAVSVGSIGAENIAISAFAQRWRAAFGTPNYFSIEAHCFRARIMARLLTFGTYPLEDPDRSDCVILWGHNPDASEPPLAARLYQAVDKGLKLIVIDPKSIPLAKKGTYVQIRPGTDAALALGMMNVIVSEGLYDKEFVEKHTVGFDRLVEHVKDYPPEKAADICGIAAEQVVEISRIFAGAKGASIIQGINALDQHINGFQTSRALAILQALTGNYDRPGAWAVNPFMKLSDLRLPVDGEPIGAEEYPMFRRLWNMTAPYGQQMLVPDVLLTGKPYPLKAMIVSGGNPAASWPDSAKLREALGKLDLMVVMDLFMTDTAKMADIVLPACSSLEMTGLAYNYGLTGGMPFAMLSPKIIAPVGECWPDWKFYTELGRRMGYGEYFPWNTAEEICEHFLKASPVTLQQLKDNPGGVWYGERCYNIEAKGQIRTPSKKIELYSQTLADAGYDPIPVHKEPTQSRARCPELAEDYPLILNTGARTVEYTHWQLKNIRELRELAPDPIAELNPATAGEYKVQDGEWMVVETQKGMIRVKAATTEDMMPGVINVLHGWSGDQNQNLLTQTAPRDPVTGYPELRAIACRIHPA
jgi:anaerobic selenocysteine-containing dehydrogenase